MVEEEDKKLIAGVIGDDPYYLKQFRERFQEKLLNLILRKVGNYQDAEELVQDTLLSAYYSLPAFEGKSSLWGWLGAIARHEIADYYRKKKIKTVLFSVFPALEKIAAASLSEEVRLEEIEIKMRIIHCFAQITEGYRQLLRLKYIEGLSTKEIAQKLETTVKAAEMRLRRARLAFIKVWRGQKSDQKAFLTLDTRELSFLAEYLGLARSSLSHLKGDSD